MLQADLAGKEFTAEKQQVIVISTGNNKAMTAKDKERNALERRAAEQRHEHRCCPQNHSTLHAAVCTASHAACHQTNSATVATRNLLLPHTSAVHHTFLTPSVHMHCIRLREMAVD